MTQSFTVTGGARIGWANASWPLARLTVTSETLSIAALMLGTYRFAPDDVIELAVFQSLPFIGRGIRIVHSRPDYPQSVIFWCLNPASLIERIAAAGFRTRAPRTSAPRHTGIPVRWSAIAAIVVVWNALFILDGFGPWNPPKPPGAFVFLALALMCAGTFALTASGTVQAWVMKPGRSVGEIRPIVTLVRVVSAFMLLGFLGFGFL